MPKRPPAARFVTELVRLDDGMRHHIVPVPDDIAAPFKTARVRRLLCTINGHPLRRALQNHADGGSFIILGQPTLAEFGLRRGSRLEVDIRADPKPNTLDIPAELSLVLAQDEAARARWETFTIGFRRSLLLYVASAKQEATRIKRSLDLARKIRTRTLHND